MVKFLFISKSNDDVVLLIKMLFIYRATECSCTNLELDICEGLLAPTTVRAGEKIRAKIRINGETK